MLRAATVLIRGLKNTHISEMNFGAILLAAGTSQRMEGENKMLLPLAESTVIGQTYAELSKCGIEIIVVTGREASAVESEISKIKNQKSKILHNPSYEKGLTTSIQAGLRAIEYADAVMICLGDMPLINTEDYRFLMDSFTNQNEYSIQVPFYRSQKGNPVIFGRQHFNEILNHTEMNGCSGVVRRNSSSVCRIEVSSDRFIQDIDTPNDYQRLLQSLK